MPFVQQVMTISPYILVALFDDVMNFIKQFLQELNKKVHHISCSSEFPLWYVGISYQDVF